MRDNLLLDPDISKVMLTREDEYCVTQMINSKALSLYKEFRAEVAAEMFTMIMRPFSETLKEEVVSYPCNALEHIKQDWLPKWVINRWPVKLTHHTVKIKAAYPCLQVSLPKEKYYFYTTRKISRDCNEVSPD